jgi:hypothetical protein
MILIIENINLLNLAFFKANNLDNKEEIFKLYKATSHQSYRNHFSKSLGINYYDISF